MTDSEIRRQLVTMRRWIGVLATAVVLLAIAVIGRADAQPAPAKSLSFVDGDQRIDLDATGLRITRSGTTRASLAITADRISAVAAEPGKEGPTLDLAVGATDAHVKVLSELGSTAIVATPKSLCMSIRQIGGKDSHTCIPPIK